MANNFQLGPKSVKDVIRECTLSAVIDIVTALRRENVDNGLLREIKAIHGNTTFDDLPPCVKAAIYNATETTLVKLMSEGYGITTVDPKQGVKYP